VIVNFGDTDYTDYTDPDYGNATIPSHGYEMLPDTTGPAPVPTFTATAGDTQVTLTWTHPPDGDLVGVKIRRSTNTYPTLTTGTEIHDDKEDVDLTYVDTGRENGRTYYYSAFAYDGAGTSNYSTSTTASATPADVTPPAPVTGFTATGGNHKVDLSWTNPSDSDFVEVEIRRSTQGFPATPTSGNHVYNCACQSYQDTGRTNGTTYYYSIFARDEVPNYSTAATDSATPPNP